MPNAFYTAEEIKEYRNNNCVSLAEALRAVKVRNMGIFIDGLMIDNDLKLLLKEMLVSL